MIQADWIALDWGTSALRVWAMSGSGKVLESRVSERGMSSLDPPDFELALLEVIGSWLRDGDRMPVIGCGMVGSKQGWMEVPYLEAPCAPLGALAAVPVSDPRFEVLLCPGVKQERPADVMRGEEVQVAGLLGEQAQFDGIVCLPGTHSKWARVSGGQIRSFQTFLTGELFGLLARESVLRHSVDREGWDQGAFLEAVGEVLAEPESVAAQLFSIRADSILGQADGTRGRSRLSGYLIGSELAATRPLWSAGGELAIIGATALGGAYQSALEAQGAKAQLHPAEAVTLAGLQLACGLLVR